MFLPEETQQLLDVPHFFEEFLERYSLKFTRRKPNYMEVNLNYKINLLFPILVHNYIHVICFLKELVRESQFQLYIQLTIL
jgi:hypothetical protein